MTNKVMEVIEFIKTMSNEQRFKLFNQILDTWCMDCGYKHPEEHICYCERDE